MLTDNLLTEYANKFYGIGNWNAKIWFVGIEEAGGWKEEDVHGRLKTWEQNGKCDLVDAPTFYPASGNNRWHGETVVLQATWMQLIRMLLVARGVKDTDETILEYQRHHLGRVEGETCLAELLPLPSPSIKDWPYTTWSGLRWLRSRDCYYAHLLVARATELARRINTVMPPIVIFYGTTFFRTWSCISGATWVQAIPDKLVTFTRGNTTFFVTKHPVDPSLGDARHSYFREIGEYLHRKHGKELAAVTEKSSKLGAIKINKSGPVVSARLDWPSMIGNFLLNFNTLDLQLQDFLEAHLPSEEYVRLRGRHFQDRATRIRQYAKQANYTPERRQAIEQFFVRLEPIRILRNHVAHGLLRLAVGEGPKNCSVTVSLPKNLDDSVSLDVRHLTFEELLKALQTLTDLTEDFTRLFGSWMTGFEVKF